MKYAVLIQCHKNPQMINSLINVMNNGLFDFYIHVDKKSDISTEIIKKDNVYIVPEEERVDVKWGTYSQVEASLKLLFMAEPKKYDHYILLSGEDFLVKPVNELIDFLEENKNKNFINLFVSKNTNGNIQTNYDKRNQILFPQCIMKKGIVCRIVRRLWVTITGGYKNTFKVFRRKDNNKIDYYFGSQWWCINKEFAKYITEFILSKKEYVEFYKKTSCPDESFFQTILMNSDFKETRVDYLHYIDWSQGGNSPKYLDLTDYDNIISSGKFFARKISDDALIGRLIKQAEGK